VLLLLISFRFVSFLLLLLILRHLWKHQYFVSECDFVDSLIVSNNDQKDKIKAILSNDEISNTKLTKEFIENIAVIKSKLCTNVNDRQLIKLLRDNLKFLNFHIFLLQIKELNLGKN